MTTTGQSFRHAIYPDAENQPPVGSADHALWLVNWHVVWERADLVDQLGQLYTDDIEWEFHIPGVDLAFTGKRDVLANYARLLGVLQDFRETLNDAYSTPTRVFTDQSISYTVGPGAEGLMDPTVLPPGATVHGRLLHNFHVRDGLLAREIAYFIPNQPEDL